MRDKFGGKRVPPMPAIFPCPNCANPRKSADASCEKCEYPRHARPLREVANSEDKKKRRFQFRLSALFVCTTVAALVFAGAKKWGLEGLQERVAIALIVASIPAPLIEFVYRFDKHHRNI